MFNVPLLYIYIYGYVCFFGGCCVVHMVCIEELMGGRSAVPVPGGFGASGGPNDGWHQWLHALTKSYLRLAVGWSSFPQLRTRLDELQMGLQSQPSTKQLGGVGLIAELLALSWLDCLLKSRLTIMF